MSIGSYSGPPSLHIGVAILLLLPLVHPLTFLCISMMRSNWHLVVWLMEIDYLCFGPTRGIDFILLPITRERKNDLIKILPYEDVWYIWFPYKKVPFWNQTRHHYNQCNQAPSHKLLVQDLKQLFKYGFHKCHAHNNTHYHKTKPESIRYLELLNHPQYTNSPSKL